MLRLTRRRRCQELTELLPASWKTSDVWQPRALHNSICQSAAVCGPYAKPDTWSRSWCARRSFACSGPVQEDEASNGARTKPNSPEQVHLAAALLKQISVRNLSEHLDREARERIAMPKDELVALVAQYVNTDCDKEIAKIIEALQISGQILSHDGRVFIRASEVAEMIVRSLPDTVAEAEAKCRELQAELEPLQQEFASIEHQAFTWRAFVAYSGLFGLLTQFALFVRLTYWELSWDVMEPLSYFTGQAAIIFCYVYFLITRRDFGYEQHFKHLTQSQKQTLMSRRGFNEAKFEHLSHELSRWQRYTRSLSKDAR